MHRISFGLLLPHGGDRERIVRMQLASTDETTRQDVATTKLKVMLDRAERNIQLATGRTWEIYSAMHVGARS